MRDSRRYEWKEATRTFDITEGEELDDKDKTIHTQVLLSDLKQILDDLAKRLSKTSKKDLQTLLDTLLSLGQARKPSKDLYAA